MAQEIYTNNNKFYD